MNTITVSNASKQLYKLLDLVQSTHQPVYITGKKGSGVLISEDDFAAIEETLHLQAIPGMTKSIIEGLQTDIEDCSEDIDW